MCPLPPASRPAAAACLSVGRAANNWRRSQLACVHVVRAFTCVRALTCRCVQVDHEITAQFNFMLGTAPGLYHLDDGALQYEELDMTYMDPKVGGGGRGGAGRPALPGGPGYLHSTAWCCLAWPAYAASLLGCCLGTGSTGAGMYLSCFRFAPPGWDCNATQCSCAGPMGRRVLRFCHLSCAPPPRPASRLRLRFRARAGSGNAHQCAPHGRLCAAPDGLGRRAAAAGRAAGEAGRVPPPSLRANMMMMQAAHAFWTSPPAMQSSGLRMRCPCSIWACGTALVHAVAAVAALHCDRPAAPSAAVEVTVGWQRHGRKLDARRARLLHTTRASATPPKCRVLCAFKRPKEVLAMFGAPSSSTCNTPAAHCLPACLPASPPADIRGAPDAGGVGIRHGIRAASGACVVRCANMPAAAGEAVGIGLDRAAPACGPSRGWGWV